MVVNNLLLLLLSCSPERKRRVSSRVTAKKDPSPPPARLPSLRQSVPCSRPPVLVNGKTDAASAGRTRSSARSSTHASTAPTTSHSAASSTQGVTTGETTSHQHRNTLQANQLLIFLFLLLLTTESTRSLRAHGSVGAPTPPVTEKATASLAAENVGGGSALRKVKTPVRHTAGTGLSCNQHEIVGYFWKSLCETNLKVGNHRKSN